MRLSASDLHYFFLQNIVKKVQYHIIDHQNVHAIKLIICDWPNVASISICDVILNKIYSFDLLDYCGSILSNDHILIFLNILDLIQMALGLICYCLERLFLMHKDLICLVLDNLVTIVLKLKYHQADYHQFKVSLVVSICLLQMILCNHQ